MANNIEKMLPCSFNLKATIKQIQSEAIHVESMDSICHCTAYISCSTVSTILSTLYYYLWLYRALLLLVVLVVVVLVL